MCSLLDQHITLFGLVLAIGIVVDDAIVRGRERRAQYRGRAQPPLESCASGYERGFRAIVAIALVLCSVFVPMAFLTASPVPSTSSSP